jgi:hypothetical protein
MQPKKKSPIWPGSSFLNALPRYRRMATADCEVAAAPCARAAAARPTPTPRPLRSSSGPPLPSQTPTRLAVLPRYRRMATADCEAAAAACARAAGARPTPTPRPLRSSSGPPLPSQTPTWLAVQAPPACPDATRSAQAARVVQLRGVALDRVCRCGRRNAGPPCSASHRLGFDFY